MKGHHVVGFFAAPLAQGFADAENRTHAVGHHRRDFLRDHRIAFVKDVAPLGVTENDIMATGFTEHRRADFAGKRAALGPVAILRGQFDITVAQLPRD